MPPPRRILIKGLPGSGKTLLAKKLAQETGIAHIEADRLFWREGRPSPLTEFRSEVSSLLTHPEWIYEGHFSKVADLVEPRATEIIVLRPFRLLSFLRMIKRDLIILVKEPSYFQRFRGNCLRYLRNSAPTAQ